MLWLDWVLWTHPSVSRQHSTIVFFNSNYQRALPFPQNRKWWKTKNRDPPPYIHDQLLQRILVQWSSHGYYCLCTILNHLYDETKTPIQSCTSHGIREGKFLPADYLGIVETETQELSSNILVFETGRSSSLSHQQPCWAMKEGWGERTIHQPSIIV